MAKYAPILLFVYNRLWHTRQTIDYLLKNELAIESRLIIYSDGYKSSDDKQEVESVREYISSIKGFKSVEIHTREKNFGLAANVIDGVTQAVDQYGKVIVLEDDIVTSPQYLAFMNRALIDFADEKDFMSVSGYLYPIEIPSTYSKQLIASHRMSSWGWGTWKDRWQQVEFDMDKLFSEHSLKEIKKITKGGEDLFYMLMSQKRGKIDSWAVRFALAHALHNKYTLFPVVSYCKNIGLDGSGTHCNETSVWDVDVAQYIIENWSTPFLNEDIQKEVRKLFSYTFPRKIFTKIRALTGL